MYALHICQEDLTVDLAEVERRGHLVDYHSGPKNRGRYGFWFVVAEESENGPLRVVVSAAPREEAEHDAERIAGRFGIPPERIFRDTHNPRPYPVGGVVPGYQPPQPRRAI